MPRIVTFDEAATPQRVLGVTGVSENEGPWNASGRTDFVISPDLSLLIDLVSRRYWKHDSGSIVEYTQAEKDAQDASEAVAHDASVREGAESGLVGFHGDALLLRAFADVIKDEINVLRAQHSLPDRTLAQLKSAINSRINDGTVDS
jgi:hypothetical protein